MLSIWKRYHQTPETPWHSTTPVTALARNQGNCGSDGLEKEVNDLRGNAGPIECDVQLHSFESHSVLGRTHVTLSVRLLSDDWNVKNVGTIIRQRHDICTVIAAFYFDLSTVL